jgi:hypothetical protein
MAMSQISPPLRIALAAAVVFLAVWMVALRPSSEEAVAPATATPAPNLETGAPAESAPGQVVEQAQDAAATAEGAAVTRAGEAPAPAADAAAATAAGEVAPVPAPAGEASGKSAKTPKLPVPVLRAIADEKVLVMLFWNPRAGDDRAVRREVVRLRDHRGKAFKHYANIKDVSRYAIITRGVDLSQSPTTVVIDRRLGATPLVGFANRAEIDQAVRDALRVKR